MDKKHTHLTINLKSQTRQGIRAEIFGHWLNEVPGTSTERNTYRYDVETLSDGTLIYLLRPAYLNKGADFIIHCQGFKKFKNTKDKPPKYDDLFVEIGEISSISSSHKVEMLFSLKRIWECELSSSVVADLKLLSGNLKAERALLLAKWFFIEQDVTYWTESGRHMLKNGLEKQFGPFS